MSCNLLPLRHHLASSVRARIFSRCPPNHGDAKSTPVCIHLKVQTVKNPQSTKGLALSPDPFPSIAPLTLGMLCLPERTGRSSLLKPGKKSCSLCT